MEEDRQPSLDPGPKIYNGPSALLGVQASFERTVEGLGSVNAGVTSQPPYLWVGVAGEGAYRLLAELELPPAILVGPACSHESLSLSLQAISRPCQASQQQSRV